MHRIDNPAHKNYKPLQNKDLLQVKKRLQTSLQTKPKNRPNVLIVALGNCREFGSVQSIKQNFFTPQD
jgi:hypothetical protein